MIYIIFLYGLLFGSFYNVCIYRLPINKSVVAPRSSCGACGHTLNGIDMIPVFSYILFRGKCRHCGEKYSMRYALVELLTGVLFAISYLRFGYSYELIVGIVLSSIVIIVSFIDIDHHIILDRFSVITVILAIFYHYFISDMTLLNIVLGFAIGGGFLLFIAIVSVMGGGDIKIMASFGLLLGFPKVILAIYLSFIIGAILLSPSLIVSKIKKRKYSSNVPFGPFLCIGTWLTFLYGNQMVDLYMTIFL